MKLNLFKWKLKGDFLQITYNSKDLNRNEMIVYNTNPLQLALNLQAMLGQKVLTWGKVQKLAERILSSPNRIF